MGTMSLQLPPYQPLPAPTPGQELLRVAVADLQPTQLCVGLAEVRSRQRDFADESAAQRQRYLRGKPVPLVRSGDGALWMVDRHHRLRALVELEPQAEAFGYLVLGLATNDRRAVLVGLTKALRTFQSFPIIYTRYSQAVLFAPPERKVLSFVLAQAQPGLDPQEVCRRIDAQTGLQALTREQFIWKTIRHFLMKTGIPVNFAITVFLGFLVGTAIAGQTFYLFTVENIRQFGALKAMGTSNWTILMMVLSQAVQVGLVGYGVGVGLAALFGWGSRGFTKLAFFMPWQVLAITAVAVFFIVLLASLLSIRKVLVVDPAIVFRG
jgi:hypothetical protein